MIELEQLLLSLESKREDIKKLGVALNLEDCKKQIKELEELSSQPDFWNDANNSQKVMQKISGFKSTVEKFEKLESHYEDLLAMVELTNEEDDESLVPDVMAEADKFLADFDALKLRTLLSGEYDANNAIITFHPGAGGTEAQDWAQMLYRMYLHWSEKHGFKFTMLDYLDGDEAGLKSATVMIQGENAYGYLKSEAGVHRLVRVSPFDSSGRRHTSFAAVEVTPEISDDTEVEIRPEDLRVDTYRASGAGGQHINKTESAVRITHLPTGIVCACQTERSQMQNRDYAMKMLRSKLIEIKEREHLEKIEDIKGEQKEIAWGAQIRSYVFMPYTLVKDHRTNFEMGNIQAVMDGDLDGFINAYLTKLSIDNSNN